MHLTNSLAGTVLACGERRKFTSRLKVTRKVQARCRLDRSSLRCFGPPHFEEKSPVLQYNTPRYLFYLTSSTLLYSGTHSLPPLPLLFFPSQSSQSHLSLLNLTSIEDYTRGTPVLLSLYISLFLCPRTVSSSVITSLGLRQLHRTAPCETQASPVESVTISLVNTPLTSASVISSATTIAER